MAALDDLLRRLESVRRSERRVALVTGAARTVVALVVAVLAYFLFDWLSEPPLSGRWAAAGLLLGLAGWVFFRGVVREWRRGADDDEVALRLEERHPELGGRLIATVQLTRAKIEGRFTASEELLEALNAETVRFAAPIAFLGIVRRELMRNAVAAAGLLLVVQIVSLVCLPGHFEALALRLVHAEQPFPTRTRIQEFAVPFHVARGEELAVAVRLDPAHEVPGTPGTLTFRDAVSGVDTAVDLTPVPGSSTAFRGVLPQALDDVLVRAQCGDARTGWRRVIVRPRPEVRSATVRYHLPSYTREPDPPPARLGPLEAIQGSTADLTLEATQPLVEARLIERSGLQIPFTRTDGEGLCWKLSEPFPIVRTTSFRLLLQDHHGLLNNKPVVEYPVAARPDAPPAIRLKRPVRDVTVTPRARLRVLFDARDDYGLRVVWLVGRVTHEGQAEDAAAEQRYELEVLPRPLKGQPPPVLNLTGQELTWGLEKLSLKVGDRVVFWLEADDFCPANNLPPARGGPAEAPAKAGPPGPWYPRTGDVRLIVISQEEKALEIQGRIARLFEELRGLKDNQEELKRKVRDLIETLQKELDANR
jgi:hypothetical protein